MRSAPLLGRGLLAECGGAPGGWDGRVSYTAQLRSHIWAAVEEWISADLSEPA